MALVSYCLRDIPPACDAGVDDEGTRFRLQAGVVTSTSRRRNSERTKEAVVSRIIAGPRTMFAIRMEFSEGTGVLQTGTIVPSLRHPAAAVSSTYASRGDS